LGKSKQQTVSDWRIANPYVETGHCIEQLVREHRTLLAGKPGYIGHIIRRALRIRIDRIQRLPSLTEVFLRNLPLIKGRYPLRQFIHIVGTGDKTVVGFIKPECRIGGMAGGEDSCPVFDRYADYLASEIGRNF